MHKMKRQKVTAL